MTIKDMLLATILIGVAMHHTVAGRSLRSHVSRSLNNDPLSEGIHVMPKGMPPKRRTLDANGDPSWDAVSCGGKGGKAGGRRQRKLCTSGDSVETGFPDSPDGGSPDGGSPDGGSPDGSADGGSPDGSTDGSSPDGGETSPSNESHDVHGNDGADGGDGVDGGTGGGGDSVDGSDGGQVSPSNEGEDINDPQEVSPSNEEDDAAGEQGSGTAPGSDVESPEIDIVFESPGITFELENLDDLGGGSQNVASTTTTAPPTHEESPSNDR